MRRNQSGVLILALLFCAVILYSIVARSSILFWGTSFFFLVLVVILCLKMRPSNLALTTVLSFNIVTGFLFEVLYNEYWNHNILPVADTNFSIQLVNIILSGGRLTPPAGTFRAVDYSYYPISFQFGAMFSHVMGISPDTFALFIYPLLCRILLILFFYLTAKTLLKNTSGAYIATAVFSLNGELLLFFSGFHYEELAWIYNMVVLYAAVKLWTTRYRKYIIFISLFAFLSAATHHLSSYFLIVFLIGLGLFSMYRRLHSKLLRIPQTVHTFTFLLSSFAAIVVILSTKLFLTWGGEGYQIATTANEALMRLLGVSTTSGILGKYNPWNYTTGQIYLIFFGNALLLAFALSCLILSLKQKAIENRLLESVALVCGFVLIMVFLVSSFTAVQTIRLFIPFGIMCGLAIGNQMGRLHREKKVGRQIVSILMLAVILFFFMSSQIIYSINYSANQIEQGPTVFTLGVKDSIDFIVRYGQLETGEIVTYPMNYFESLYARLVISSPYYSSQQATTAIASLGVKLLSKCDYVVLYLPADPSVMYYFVSPDLRGNWTAAISGIYANTSRLYDNGRTSICAR